MSALDSGNGIVVQALRRLRGMQVAAFAEQRITVVAQLLLQREHEKRHDAQHHQHGERRQATCLCALVCVAGVVGRCAHG